MQKIPVSAAENAKGFAPLIILKWWIKNPFGTRNVPIVWRASGIAPWPRSSTVRSRKTKKLTILGNINTSLKI